MGWFSSAFNKAGHLAKRTVEILNPKTEKSLKDGEPNQLSNDELMAKNSSTRRSVASAVLGAAINIGLSVACPPFAAAAVINTWQLAVSCTNCHRIKREVKRRKQDDKNFKAMYKACDRPTRDVAIGCCIKSGFAAIGMGIVGFDHIADAFQHVGHHAATAATQIAAHSAADGVAYTSTISDSSYAHHATTIAHHAHGQNLSDSHHGLGKDELAGSHGAELSREEALKYDHPNIAAVDKAVHKPFSLGDVMAKAVGKTTAGRIDTDIGWDKLHDMIEQGVSKTEAFFKVVSIGIFAEVAQPISVAAEEAFNKWYERRDRSRVTEWFRRMKPDTHAEMKSVERESQAKKQFAVQNELAAALKKRGKVPSVTVT